MEIVLIGTSLSWWERSVRWLAGCWCWERDDTCPRHLSRSWYVYMSISNHLIKYLPPPHQKINFSYVRFYSAFITLFLKLINSTQACLDVVNTLILDITFTAFGLKMQPTLYLVTVWLVVLEEMQEMFSVWCGEAEPGHNVYTESGPGGRLYTPLISLSGARTADRAACSHSDATHITQHAGSHHRPGLHQGDQGGHCQSYHLHLCEQDPAVQRDDKQDRRGRECYLIITDLWHLWTGSGCDTCDKLCLVFRVQWLVTTGRPQAVLSAVCRWWDGMGPASLSSLTT